MFMSYRMVLRIRLVYGAISPLLLNS
jgi:hypothetical protein